MAAGRADQEMNVAELSIHVRRKRGPKSGHGRGLLFRGGEINCNPETLTLLTLLCVLA